jgi:hypothetical protein
MKPLREVKGVRYELFDMNALDEMAVVIAKAFASYEPTSVALGLVVGECTQHRGRVYGLVALLFEQAKVGGRQFFSMGRNLTWVGQYSILQALRCPGANGLNLRFRSLKANNFRIED